MTMLNTKKKKEKKMQVLNLAINRNNINNGESNLKVFFLNQLNIIYQIPVYIYI